MRRSKDYLKFTFEMDQTRRPIFIVTKVEDKKTPVKQKPVRKAKS